MGHVTKAVSPWDNFLIHIQGA